MGQARQTNPRLLAALLLAAMFVAQIWIVTAGGKGWPEYSDYYRLLTEAFVHGQVSLLDPPPARLVALANPYDPAQHYGSFLYDASLYGGKYYLYWGPVPSLLAAAVCWPLGIAHPMYGDQYMGFGFMFGTCVVGTLMIFEVRRRMFPAAPNWTVAAAVAALGLSGPVMFSLACPGVYEAAIAGGQFFLLVGVTAAWFAMVDQKRWLLAVAGICWVLACGTRVSLPPAVAVMAALTGWQVWRRKPGDWGGEAALWIPLFAGAGLLAWYNWARFGSVTEFGWHYQLSGQNQNAMQLFSIHRLAANTLIYLFMPPYLSHNFPFILADGWQAQLRGVLGLQPEHHFAATVGLVWSVPFLMLGGVALWRRRWPEESNGVARWLAVTLAAGALLGIAPALLMPMATMRYLVDAVPCCGVLAAMGCYSVWETRKSRRQKRWMKAVVGAVTAGEVVQGFALGMTGYYHHFAVSNPSLFLAMQHAIQRLMGR